MLGSRSPSLQAKRVLLAAEHVFAHVPPLVESLLGIRVSTTQVYRRTQAAAQALPAAALDASYPLVSAGPGPVNGTVDGSMLFTDTGWGSESRPRLPAQCPGQCPGRVDRTVPVCRPVGSLRHFYPTF